MATVPNRYYNSPWIADAARNLSMAFGPEDPEKTVARQRANWEFQREQELARIQDEDRQQKDAGLVSLGHILTAPNAPPAPHSPGEAAYQSSQYPNGVPPSGPSQEDIQSVIQSGLPVNELYNALGADNPIVKGKMALKGADTNSALQLLMLRLADTDKNTGLLEAGRNARADETDARMRGLQADLLASKEKLDALDRASRERNTDVRAGASGNKPINVGPAQHDVLRKSVIHWARGQGVELPPNIVDAATNRALEYYKQGYNNAPDLAIADFFGSDPKVHPGVSHWVGADEPATLPLRNDMQLGDLLTILPQLGAQPEAVPQQSAPQAAAPAVTGGKKRVRVDAQGNVIGN